MNNVVRLSFLSLVGALVAFSGCAHKKKTSRLDAMQAQIGTITDELVRMDQAIQETRASIQAQESRRYEAAGSGAPSSGPTYRTPSGFELPSAHIQQALKNAGYYDGTVDGKIGPGTRDAVKAFQRDNGLKPDGVVGRQTWGKLKTHLSGAK